MVCRNWRTEDGKIAWPRFIASIIGGILMLFAFTSVFGFVFQALWNWLMPSLFHLAEITYYEAFGLMILARLLTGGFCHHHGHHGYRRSSRYGNSCRSEEFENWQHYDAWWNAEGKDAFQKFAESQGAESKPRKSKKKVT